MTFRVVTSQAIDQAFRDAEHAGRCLWPDNSALRKALKRRVSEGLVVIPFKSMYARSAYWQDKTFREKIQHIIRTLSSKYPSWIFSHASAAVMYGLEVPRSLGFPLHCITGTRGTQSNSKQIICHRVRNLYSKELSQALVTLPEQTIIDCAVMYSFQQALPIVDSALHLGLTNKERLLAYLELNPRRKGVRKAHRVLRYADARADNGGESTVRAVMIENGLPLPELQIPVPNINKLGHYYYVDFMFTCPNGQKIAFELDGRAKYQDSSMTKGRDTLSVMMDERQREAAITAHGIRVARLGYSQAIKPEILLPTLAAYGVVPL